MLGTIILQPYTKEERNKVADSLNELCHPNENYGWASAGVYSYWNYYTNEVLYIGLASDLTQRFKQHNGFHKSIDKKTCKVEKIQEYFDKNEKIGFSIIVQSIISQPFTSKLKKRGAEKSSSFIDFHGNEGIESIKHQEGLLIEAYKLANGKIPEWNKINGAKSGRKSAKLKNYESLKIISNQNKHLLLSKSSLFEIAENPTFERFENFLHSVRISTPTLGYATSLKLSRVNDENTYSQMLSENYFDKELNI
ncbi:GIY-YIG nuclease family protein [Tenacibaculum discolor]|uniref:GIY-YIG nuclease family protein n=1 Tax=Tenacibaculum discolor TaxID=361581 RepID=UPI000F59DDF9|nr:GIY-YIG nuclease family protein [Tenacibaculum discolor]